MRRLARRITRALRSPALAAGLLAGALPSTASAGAPELGTPEGELFCAKTMRTLAGGALLTTGEDALPAVKAYGIFLGRLSLIAPEATTRDFLDEPADKLLAEEAGAAIDACLRKAAEIDDKHRRP